jgi:hypothetical protein
MVAGVCAVQIKGREFTEKIVWGLPNLHMHFSCNANESND